MFLVSEVPLDGRVPDTYWMLFCAEPTALLGPTGARLPYVHGPRVYAVWRCEKLGLQTSRRRESERESMFV